MPHKTQPKNQPPLWPGAVVFITGGVIMVLELVGSRLVAPYFGTSTFVWTGLIGVILGCLSLGYWLGGKLADRQLSTLVLATIILASSAAMIVLGFITDPLLQTIQTLFNDIRLAISLATVLLFGPPTVLLAMVTPYTTRLAITQLKTSGQALGTMYALSTLGSIVGTFATGFFLLAWFGSHTIISLLAVTLLVTASFLFLAAFRAQIAKKKSFKRFLITAVSLILSSILVLLHQQTKLAADIVLDKDTAYQRIILRRGKDATTNRPALYLSYGPRAAQSGIFLDIDDELVLSYTRFFRLGEWFKPNLKKALMIGGGGYSYPKEFLKTFPEAEIDVVEIDPEVTQVAQEYFDLKQDHRLQTFNQDGRQFLKTATQDHYDIIYVDAFGSNYGIPFHLTTIEVVRQFDHILNSDGIVIMNIISAIEGKYADFFQAEYATYQSVFPYLYTFQVQQPAEPNQTQNLILVASKKPLQTTSDDPFFEQYLSRQYTAPIPLNKEILTDAFAPVEHYLWPLQQANWK